MPEVKVAIGGREYEVACQDGEEHFLQSAARLLDAEATVLSDQIGRIPETRMLLMSGLMLADKTAGMEEQLRRMEQQVTVLSEEVQALKSAPAPEPHRVEVPVIPAAVVDTMAELAARAEAIADRVEERAAE
ncbi:cell division protein ZapA [Rhodobacteraceae bacterium CCMM004]|nr:cell division protein ZapA [Rhodobacteraceae bacterium CCMM004]